MKLFLAYLYIVLYILGLYGLTIIGIINFAMGIEEMNRKEINDES